MGPGRAALAMPRSRLGGRPAGRPASGKLPRPPAASPPPQGNVRVLSALSLQTLLLSQADVSKTQIPAHRHQLLAVESVSQGAARMAPGCVTRGRRCRFAHLCSGYEPAVVQAGAGFGSHHGYHTVSVI